MNTFKSSAELKASAREQMFGRYGIAAGSVIIVGGIIGSAMMTTAFLVDMTTIAGTVIYYAISFLITLIVGLFTSGTTYLYLKIICGRPASIGDLFYGFRLCPDKAIIIQAWITFITYTASLPMIILNYRISNTDSVSEAMNLTLPYCLCTILWMVVSVIISLLYAQAFYLLHDFPQYSAKELLFKSRRMMKGHKGRMFYLYVSFLPLMLLALFSCGLALLWVIPYLNATRTEFFLDLIQNSEPDRY